MVRTRNKIYLGSVVTILAASGLALAATQGQQSNNDIASDLTPVAGAEPFTERFSTIDRKRWSVSHNWSNGRYMVNDWQKSQSKADIGLTLTLAPDVAQKHPYSSGEVQSKRVYGHGYFETEMRAAPGSGVVTGFFTYTGPHFGKPWNEIDVEILGAKPREILLTYFYHGKKISHIHNVDFDATQEIHSYGFDWQPGSIEWFIDGKSVHKTVGEELPLPNEAQKIMMSVWASKTLTSWVGKFDRSATPTSAYFACVGYATNAKIPTPCS